VIRKHNEVIDVSGDNTNIKSIAFDANNYKVYTIEVEVPEVN